MEMEHVVPAIGNGDLDFVKEIDAFETGGVNRS
jgi:hypothetical protein